MKGTRMRVLHLWSWLLQIRHRYRSGAITLDGKYTIKIYPLDK